METSSTPFLKDIISPNAFLTSSDTPYNVDLTTTSLFQELCDVNRRLDNQVLIQLKKQKRQKRRINDPTSGPFPTVKVIADSVNGIDYKETGKSSNSVTPQREKRSHPVSETAARTKAKQPKCDIFGPLDE